MVYQSCFQLLGSHLDLHTQMKNLHIQHVSPNYFGKGVRWQLPDLDTSEIGYALARDAYQKAGREVLDATVGGKLTIFPKVDYNSLF